MDQDFHYYGTYYAARMGGLSQDEATLVGSSSNFIDFLHQKKYGGYWKLVRTPKGSSVFFLGECPVLGELTNPRYTFQGGLASPGLSPEDGLWCSYHFTPGNYPDPRGTPSSRSVHGAAIDGQLPGHELRPVKTKIDIKRRKLLNRPQSALSRALLLDAIACATDRHRLVRILARALGGWELLDDPRNDNLKRFGLILLGVRAHVIADTWAHQDFSGISHEMNTYYDLTGKLGRQAIEYEDSTGTHEVVLGSTQPDNLRAAPNKTSYLGHGWMGHFPDYSFVKFRYRPWWLEKSSPPLERDNPTQYQHAFLELISLFSKTKGITYDPNSLGNRTLLAAAKRAMSAKCEIANAAVCPRKFSSEAWLSEMTTVGIAQPSNIIDAKLEPDPKAVLHGVLKASSSSTRYGSYYVDVSSDLYLFQIAADYHYHFVRHWLKKNKIMEFTGSWSQKLGPLPDLISDLF